VSRSVRERAPETREANKKEGKTFRNKERRMDVRKKQRTEIEKRKVEKKNGRCVFLDSPVRTRHFETHLLQGAPYFRLNCTTLTKKLVKQEKIH
jgi:hypothetical protein